MKRHLSFAAILLFFALIFPQLAFADLAPEPKPEPDTPAPQEESKDNDDDCSALPLTKGSQNLSIMLILMASLGVISMGAIYRLNKKSE